MVPLTVSVLCVFLWCICHSPAQASWWQCVHVRLRETWNGSTSPINIHQDIQGDNKHYYVLPFIGKFFHYFPLATTQAGLFSVRGLSVWVMVHGVQCSTEETPRRQASRRVWLAILLRFLASGILLQGMYDRLALKWEKLWEKENEGCSYLLLACT